MSYDLNIWSRGKVKTEQKEIWLGEHLVTVEDSVPVEKEDIPIPILLSHEGIRYLTSLHLQPFTKDATITKKLMRMAGKLAKEADGLVENPQDEPASFPIGEKTGKGGMRDADMVSIVWYLSPDEPLSTSASDFIALLEKYLPQAVPRRYGSFEPPQFKYAETGKEHLISFLGSEHKPVLYGTRPVTYIFLSDAYIDNQKSQHYKGGGFRCNKIEITLLREAYVKQNWQYAVRRLFREVAIRYRPFYAEIIEEEKSMVCSWWWKGIPARRGNPVIVGEPYSSLCSSLPKENRIGPGLFYFEDTVKPRIPGSLVSRKKLFTGMRSGAGFSADSFRYARVFPFEIPD